MNHDGGSHAAVIRAAQLGTNDRVRPRLGGREGQQGRLPWDHVLFEAKLGHPEGMDHITGLHAQLNALPQGNVQLTAGDTSSGIVKNEGELHRRYLNRQHRAAIARSTDASPDATL